MTSTSTDNVYRLDIPDNLELENFKAFCEAESGIPAEEMVIIFNGKTLNEDKKAMKDYGVKEGEMIVMERIRKKKAKEDSPQGNTNQPSAMTSGMPDFSQIKVPKPGQPSTSSSASSSRSGENDPAYIRDMLRANPDQLALLKQNNPRLAEALDASFEEFSKVKARAKRRGRCIWNIVGSFILTQVLKEQQEARAKRELERIRMLTADPFDMEAQRLIAQEIENKNVEHNMELAIEHNPESFGTVIMLYIDCKVNGHPIKAFVDSGAQATIMSQASLLQLSPHSLQLTNDGFLGCRRTLWDHAPH